PAVRDRARGAAVQRPWVGRAPGPAAAGREGHGEVPPGRPEPDPRLRPICRAVSRVTRPGTAVHRGPLALETPRAAGSGAGRTGAGRPGGAGPGQARNAADRRAGPGPEADQCPPGAVDYRRRAVPRPRATGVG